MDALRDAASSTMTTLLAERSTPIKPETYDPLTLGTLITTCVLIIILNSYRIFHHHHRGEKLTKLHYWMAASIVFIILRFGFIYVSTVNLTANFNRTKFPESWMSQEEKDRRELGAQMVLPGRAAYAMFVWAMKICVLYWIENVIQREKLWGKVFDATFWVFITTLVAVLGTTFLECQPVRLYWQLYPDPGTCNHAQTQLITMGVLNIFTDLLLIVIPLPVLIRLHLPLIQKLQLATLFSVSLFVVVVTIIRMPLIVQAGSLQKLRSFWASVECLAAAIVANAPMFNALFQDWLAKRRVNSTIVILGPNGAGGGGTEGGGALGDVRGTLRSGRRKGRAPVTGLDSVGSLTRNETDVAEEKSWGLTPGGVHRPSICSTSGVGGGQPRKPSVAWGGDSGNSAPFGHGTDWAEMQDRPGFGGSWGNMSGKTESAIGWNGNFGFGESSPDRPPSSITKPPTKVEDSWFRV